MRPRGQTGTLVPNRPTGTGAGSSRALSRREEAMTKDQELCSFWDPDASARRLLEAPNWDDQVVAGSPGNGHTEIGESSESQLVWALGMPGGVDSCLQRAVEAGATACEADSPDAWRQVILAAAVLSDMAHTRELVAEVKQSARKLSQAAQVAQRLAQEAVDVATNAVQKVQHLEAVVAKASEANSEEAWREAHQTVLALTGTE